MGFLTNLIKEQDAKKDENASQAKERLNLLKQTAEYKLENYKKQMETDFYNSQSAKESFSIIGRPIEYLAQYRINIRSGLSNEIENAISDLFRFNKQGLVQALKIMVTATLKEAFITTTIGEENFEGFYIVPYNNTIVRLDFKAWKYTFSNTGVMGTVENAFCYVTSKSIINFSLLTVEEIIYFLTEACGGAPTEAVKDYIQDVVDIYKFVTKLHTSQFGVGISNDLLKSNNHMQLIEQIRTKDITNWEIL